MTVDDPLAASSSEPEIKVRILSPNHEHALIPLDARAIGRDVRAHETACAITVAQVGRLCMRAVIALHEEILNLAAMTNAQVCNTKFADTDFTKSLMMKTSCPFRSIPAEMLAMAMIHCSSHR